MTSAFMAENHRRRTKMTLPVWEHTCCGETYWSAARLCDRCATAATVTIDDLSIADALAGRRLPPLTWPRPPAQPAAAPPQPTPPPDALPVASAPVARTQVHAQVIAPPVRHPMEEVEQLFVFVLWCTAGVVSSVTALGAFVEFGDGRYFLSICWALAASSTPLAALYTALDGRLQRVALKRFGQP